MSRRKFRRGRKNWDKLITKLKDTGHLTPVAGIEKGKLHILQIEHDDDCSMLHGGDHCTCEETTGSLLQYSEESKFDA